MKTALYIGNFSFPLGNASGKRVYANGKILKELGYQVVYIGMSKDISVQTPLKYTKSIYDGFIYYNFPYPKRSLEWINYRKNFNELVRFLKEENIINNLNLVIYYGSPTLSIFNIKLITFCKRNNIKVVADCVDWLTTKTKNPLFDIVKWMDNTYQKAYANKKTDGVIAISTYLADYYGEFGCKTVVVPPLSPIICKTQEFTIKRTNNNTKKIITYAGIPFRKGEMISNTNYLKDRIDKTIILLYKIKKCGYDFLFNIYGFTKEEYLKVIPSQEKYIEAIGESICFHGFKTSEEVVQKLKESDFTILIRDVNRDTTAGFPTKISESISYGVPVITTKTSDLETYITEGVNGFFIDFDEKKAIEKLKSILDIDEHMLLMMKYNCIKSQMFYYKSYLDRFNSFIESVISK